MIFLTIYLFYSSALLILESILLQDLQLHVIFLILQIFDR